MWHPNIFADGRVCISILHPPGTDRFNDQETADERWRPILGVHSILISAGSPEVSLVSGGLGASFGVMAF
ncbi:UBC7 [Symbiodinium sp. CCMP2592]|nr:UBC7 [Symbiodinium sp. CCMP2592]